MSQSQRIIKNLAIALAIFLATTIIGSIFYGIASFIDIFNKEDIPFKTIEIKEEINSLNIDLSSTSLVIKEGKKFNIETNNKYIKANVNLEELKLEEKGHYFFKNNNTKLIITVPEEQIFKTTSLSTGIGKVEIDSLTTDEIDFKLGTGKVDIKKLKVLNKTKIEGGVGEINITDSDISNLDGEIGVGSISLTSILRGTNKIESGIGEVNINLIGTKKDYKLSLEKGLGKIMIDNITIDDKTYGEGTNYLKLEGGIGDIKVYFNE